MQEVGFWRRYEGAEHDLNDDRPWPSPGRSDLMADDVLAYLQLGYLESYEFGFSTCRLCGLTGIAMGSCSLTDGQHVWPEGLPHYVSEHGVALPESFVEHAHANLPRLRAIHDFRRAAGTNAVTGTLLQWDQHAQRAMPAASGAVAWVLENSRLGEHRIRHQNNRCCLEGHSTRGDACLSGRCCEYF